MKKGRVQIGRSNETSAHKLPQVKSVYRHDSPDQPQRRTRLNSECTHLTPDRMRRPRKHATSFIDEKNFKYDIFNPGNCAERFIQKVSRKAKAPQIQRVDSAEDLNIPFGADKEKVLWVRRAIRSKFCGHKDLKGLFSQWDKDRIGVIRPQDVQFALKQVDIVADLNDIKSMIMAVAGNKLGALTYADFAKLLEQKQVSYDLDAYLKANLIELTSQKSLNLSYRVRKIQNLLKYYLNLNQESLRKELERQDRRGDGRVTYHTFVQIMNILGIPYHTVNGLNLKILFFDLGGDAYGMDYAKFLEHIEKCTPFVLDAEEEEGLELKITQGMMTMSKFNDLHDAGARVKRLIRVSVGTRDNLLKELLERFGVKISREELRYYVSTKGRLPKEDVEEFLGLFMYDKKNQTPINSLVEWLYSSEKDRGIKEYVLPKIARTALTPFEKYKQMLVAIKEKIIDKDGYEVFDVTRTGHVGRRHVHEELEKNNILFEDESFKRLFEDIKVEPIPLIEFKLSFQEKFKEAMDVNERKRYLRPMKMGNCDSKMHRESRESLASRSSLTHLN